MLQRGSVPCLVLITASAEAARAVRLPDCCYSTITHAKVFDRNCSMFEAR